ncbi:MAG: glycosyltransferase [Fusobacterium sp.]
MKFCFVILHYKNLKDTLECINSIEKKLLAKDYKIIVVDNGSLDETTEGLKELEKINKNIDIIFSNENLGFARGNNLGCGFAIKKYIPEFLVVINNDTLIIENNFLEKIENKYLETEFDILGPYIEGKDGNPQNPYLNVIYGKKQIIKNLLKTKIYLYLEYFNLNIVRKFLRKIIKKKEEYNYLKEEKDIALMGAALIFSKKYYKKYRDVFYNKTFMYCEEDILFYRIKKDNLISVYDPTIKIFHKEESTTNKLNTSSKQQKIFKLKNQYNSLKVYLELIEGKKYE